VARNGRSFYVRILYWSDKDPMNLSGRNRYNGPGIIREGYGRNRGMYTAIDPYEGRSASFKTRAEAVAQYQSYLTDRNINLTRGAADALASLGTGNPLSALLYEWGADAVIGTPDPNSNVYTITNRTTNTVIAVGTFTAGGGIAALRGAQGLSSTSAAITATGQRHHLLTSKIMRALGSHDNLKGVFNRENARFIYNAADEAAHRGYQKWHRRYDKEVTDWIENNKQATPEEFIQYLDELHQQEWLRKHIPNVNLGGN